MHLFLILALLASSIGLTSCGGTSRGAMERAHTHPSDRVSSPDTTPSCPAPIACPPPPDHRAIGLPANIDTVLWLRLDSLVHTLHDPTGGILGAAVLRTRDSALVWHRNPDLRILPASTMKVLTAAAALEDLGPEFRWKTSVWATAPIVNGILKGNLILEGGGDPTFGVEGIGMSPLMSSLVRSGLKEVHGNVIALDTMVGRDLDVWPSGWTITNSQDGYGAPITGLNWGQNRTSTRSIAEPRRLALTVFAKALAARKIKVRGTDTTILVRGDVLPSRQNWELVARVQSPKLAEVLRTCMVHSVNPYAEAVILAMGVRRPLSKIAPRDQGKRRYRQILAGLGMPASITADDGSGLSRYNLVTAQAMAELLRRDMSHTEGYRATELLPRGGQGTLRHRFGRLPSPTWVSGKTGTLDGTSSLVGILRVPGRDTLAFAFLSTGFQGRASRIRGFQDRLLMSLAGQDQRDLLDSIAPTDSTIPDLDDLPVDSAPRVPPVLPESLALQATAPPPPAGAPLPLSDSSNAASPSVAPIPNTILKESLTAPPVFAPSAADHATGRAARPLPGSAASPTGSGVVKDSVSAPLRPTIPKDHTSNLPAQRRPTDPGSSTPFLSPSPAILPIEAARPPSPGSIGPNEQEMADSAPPPAYDSLPSPPLDSSILPEPMPSIESPPPALEPAPDLPLQSPAPAVADEAAPTSDTPLPASSAGPDTPPHSSNDLPANDSRSPTLPNFDSLPQLQTTPPDPETEPARDSESPLVPSGTDPDKVTP